MVMRTGGIGNFQLPRGGRRNTPQQKGYRNVRHIGGRLTQTESAGQCLAAGPILQGESLVTTDLFGYFVTDSDIQPDSAVPYEFVFFAVHGLDMSGSQKYAATSTLDGAITSVYEQNSNVGPWEFNVGASVSNDQPQFGASLGLDNQVELIWNRSGALTNLANAAAYNGATVTNYRHAGDSFRKVLKKNLYFPEGGYWLMGVYKPNADAETGEFGIEDWYPTMEDLSNVVLASPDDFGGLAAVEQRFTELLYGGDKYIEADTWKEDDFRSEIFAQLRFKTPFPQWGAEARS